MTESALVPMVVEQKTVEFYEDELVAIRASNGHIYVSLRHLCNVLGIDVQAQTRRLQRQSVLERGFDQVPIMTPNRGEQQVYIPLRPICEYLGLDWSAQTRRIRRDPVLNKWAKFVAITATNPEEAQKGGNPNMFCLVLDSLKRFCLQDVRQIVSN